MKLEYIKEGGCSIMEGFGNVQQGLKIYGIKGLGVETRTASNKCHIFI